ncbi:uncharacterized protein LOC142348870 isoform X2 [Convolutriloba macropyga]|uniref:uncharacterized protein LOC142348870 isoform X2 n=1 Tax=Convolutriloba macropyga TaxID=536237 RepID=UPI003F51BCE2
MEKILDTAYKWTCDTFKDATGPLEQIMKTHEMILKEHLQLAEQCLDAANQMDVFCEALVRHRLDCLEKIEEFEQEWAALEEETKCVIEETGEKGANDEEIGTNQVPSSDQANNSSRHENSEQDVEMLNRHQVVDDNADRGPQDVAINGAEKEDKIKKCDKCLLHSRMNNLCLNVNDFVLVEHYSDGVDDRDNVPEWSYAKIIGCHRNVCDEIFYELKSATNLDVVDFENFAAISDRNKSLDHVFVLSNRLAFAHPFPKTNYKIGNSVLIRSRHSETTGENHNLRENSTSYVKGIIADLPRCENQDRYLVIVEGGAVGYARGEQVIPIVEDSSKSILEKMSTDVSSSIQVFLNLCEKYESIQVLMPVSSSKMHLISGPQVCSTTGDILSETLETIVNKCCVLMLNCKLPDDSLRWVFSFGPELHRIQQNQLWVDLKESSNELAAPMPTKASGDKQYAEINDKKGQSQKPTVASFKDWALRVVEEGAKITDPVLGKTLPDADEAGQHKCWWAKCVKELPAEEAAKSRLFAKGPFAIPFKMGFGRCWDPSMQSCFYRALCGKTSFTKHSQLASLMKRGVQRKDYLELGMFVFDANVRVNPDHVIELEKSSVAIEDLSGGKEPCPVPVVNEVDDSLDLQFVYAVKSRVDPGSRVASSIQEVILRQQQQSLPPSSASVQTQSVNQQSSASAVFTCCECSGLCNDYEKCACVRATVDRYWKSTMAPSRISSTQGQDGYEVKAGASSVRCGYEYGLLLNTVPSGIFECCPKCRCEQNCTNRSSQGGLRLQLALVRSKVRGWSVITRQDLPKGIFVSLLCGVMRDSSEAYQNVAKERREHFALDLVSDVTDRHVGPYSAITHRQQNVGLNADGRKGQQLTGNGFQINGKGITSPKNSSSDDSSFGDSVIQPLQDVEMQEKSDNCKAATDEEQNQMLSNPFMEESLHELRGILRHEDTSVPSYDASRGEKDLFYLDYSAHGNITKFFNHSCDPNLVAQPVFHMLRDTRFHEVAFFAKRNIKAGEELTFAHRYTNAGVVQRGSESRHQQRSSVQVGSVSAQANEENFVWCDCGSFNCRQKLY